MTLTILDFELSKTIIVECSNAISDMDSYVAELVGHSSYHYITSDTLRLDLKLSNSNEYSHISIRPKGKGCVFNGTFGNLVETIKDCFDIAEAIRLDIDADNISEDCGELDFELYNNFSQKYQ